MRRYFLCAALLFASAARAASHQFNPKMLETRFAIQRMENIVRLARVLITLNRDVKTTLDCFRAAAALGEPTVEKSVSVRVFNDRRLVTQQALDIQKIKTAIGLRDLIQSPFWCGDFIMSRDLYDEFRKL